MNYIITFLEGIIAFISPCMLPLLPIYVSYFAGGEENRKRTIKNAIGFVLGFTVVFVLLGAFAGTLGSMLVRYSKWINIVAGGIIVVFGLIYMDVIRISFLKRNSGFDYKQQEPGIFSSILFGIIFSIGWTPCVGAFLGSALMLAATSQESYKGVLMLFSFSMGLGIPFIISAVILDKLKGVFDFIKRNYKIINIISGLLLIILGIAMMTGLLGKLLAVFSY
ncbi:MAG TPA: cytochrome c biogenesis protein CcdA [Clostridiaceae bacterium]|jgi:cytochrome c-type biogenesis protein|nr:cytochrome c biogenesis protein CcdA [Clostridiaceae bacterium]